MAEQSKFNFANTPGALTAAALLTGNNKAAAVIGGAVAIGNIVSSIRKASSGLAGTELGQITTSAVQAIWASGNTDWRVRLNFPINAGAAYAAGANSIMAPLFQDGMNALIFPFTPSVTMTHTANYNSLEATHTNYPFLAYQNSKVEQITITGTFYCETGVDAAYWLAAVHYLRSVTKMAFGDSGGDTGQPPPVLKLNGYGDYVFNNLPVVVKNFTVELPNDVDYISSGIYAGSQPLDFTGTPFLATKTGYAPTKSTMTVVLLPIYSRTQIRQFNLKSFVNGDYVLGPSSSTSGFI
jgi:hypothetical protein